MKILVACDGSFQSEQAVKMAAHLPFKDATYRLVNVTPLIEYDYKFISEEAGEKIEEFNAEVKADAAKVLAKAKATLKELGRDASTETVTGSPSEKLIGLSDQADLVIMGARGLNPVKSFFLGSVSDAILRHSHASVLIFRGDKEYDPPKKGHRITLGYDDTKSSRAAVDFLNLLDLKKVESIDLVAVLQMSFYYGMNYSLTALEAWPEYQKTVEESLQTIEKNIRKTNETTQINSEIHTDALDVASDLNDHAKKSGSHLLVTGSKGKTTVDRVFLGSVSNKLAHHAEIPLLVVR